MKLIDTLINRHHRLPGNMWSSLGLTENTCKGLVTQVKTADNHVYVDFS